MAPLDPLNLRLLLLALLIEAVFGYPDFLYRLIRHPAVWLGVLVRECERALNRGRFAERGRRWLGILALSLVVEVAACAGWLVVTVLYEIPYGWVIAAILAASLLAQRSLRRHVAAVAGALTTGGVEAGRRAVAAIVGRDTEALDEAGICRAAIESLAENLSDGVVAPSFWLALGGLPGMVIYKAINTADSMIGHRTPRYQAFGWGAAKLDDIVNWPAARLTALLILVAALVTPGASASRSWRAIRRDAKHHRSPNAGWCEAAMAGALGLKLAGPRSYGAEPVTDAWMGDGRAEATPADIARALRLYWIACVLLWFLAAAGAALVMVR